MRQDTILQALRFALLLELLPGAAEAKGSVVFWISPQGLAAFPAWTAGAGGITTAPAASPPVRITGEDSAENDEFENSIKLGSDLYYANDFGKSESILSAVWKDLQAQREARSVPARLLAECFAFRMLILKIHGKTEQAQSLALEAGPIVRKDLLDSMDIPPDGLAFIKDALDKANPKVHELTVALPPPDGQCTILVDEAPCPSVNGAILLTGAVHWIRAECGKAMGWGWRVEMPMFAGKVLHLSPDDESACDPSAFPVIACGRLTQGVLDIGSNFWAYSDIDAVLALKPSEKDGRSGVAIADLLMPEGATLADLQWKWKPLPEQQATPPNAFIDKAPEKKKLNKISLALGLAGVAAAGVSTGLGIWSLHLQGSNHAIRDPWERQEAEKKCKGVENAAIALSALAVSLVISSIIYYAVSHKKHKIQQAGLETQVDRNIYIENLLIFENP